MKRIRLRSLLLVFIFIPFLVNAQEQLAAIEGFIKDAKTGEHLLSANVAVQEVNKGISSDKKGFFVLDNLNPGTYTLVCSYLGYQQYEETVILEQGETLKIEVQLVPKNLKMDEIVVKSKSNTGIERSHINAQFVSGELIEKLPAVESDILQSLQMMPGIQASSDYSSQLYIRGGSPDHTLILLDKTPVYGPTHFFGFYSTFNPDVIDDVILYKGGYPAKYGGRLGSVLSLKSQRGNTDKAGASVTASMLASRIAVEGPVPKGSWKISSRRSTIGPVLEVLRNHASGVPDDYHFYDSNASLSLHPTAKDIFNLNMYAGKDHIVFPVAGESALIMDYGNQTANLNWEHSFSSNFYSTITLSGSRYFKKSVLDEAGYSVQKDNEIEDYTVHAEFDYNPGERHHFQFGASAATTEVLLSDGLDGGKSFRNTIQNETISAYIQDEWMPFQKLKITPGFRFTQYLNGGHQFAEPRLTVEFLPWEKLTLHASYGEYNQSMSLMTNEAFTGFDMWMASGEGIKPSHGRQYVAGIQSTLFKSYSLSADFYYNEMNDLFEPDPYTRHQPSMDYKEQFRVGEGYSYGMELQFEKRAGKLTGFIGYSLGYTWRKFPGYNRSPIESDSKGRYYPPKYDRRHDLTAVLSLDINNHWNITTAFTYATGQAYTQVTGRYAAVTLPHIPFRDNVFTVEKVNAGRLPDYHRMDVSLSRSGSMFSKYDYKLSMQLINVYSRRNIWFYNYSFETNPVKRREIKLLPIIPALSYTINF